MRCRHFFNYIDLGKVTITSTISQHVNWKATLPAIRLGRKATSLASKTYLLDYDVQRIHYFNEDCIMRPKAVWRQQTS